jgi:hypothetical protein
MTDRARHSRQSRLAEVGEGGQERLGRAEVGVAGTGPAAVVAARYLAGAGLGSLRTRDGAAARAARAVDPAVRAVVDETTQPASCPLPFDVDDPAARAVASGAYAALRAIRAIVLHDA